MPSSRETEHPIATVAGVWSKIIQLQREIDEKNRQHHLSMEPLDKQMARLIERKMELIWGIEVGQRFRVSECAARDRGKYFLCAGFDARWMRATPVNYKTQEPTEKERVLYFINAGDVIVLAGGET